MLNRSPRQRNPKGSAVSSAGSWGSTDIGRQIQAFCHESNLYYEVASDGKMITPKLGATKLISESEQMIMKQYSLYWEPLLHDLAFIEQMRDNISLVSGAFQKFVNLVMEGFHLECEDPADNEEVADLLVNDPQVDFSEVVRSAAHQISTIANCYFKPIYVTDAKGFRISTFRPIRATAMRKLRDENLITQGYVQLLHRASEFIFGAPTIPQFYLAEEICCGQSYTDGWYAYGVPPLASLPFVAKMKLQMERDMVEMFHQHVPRIDITYTPDPQMNDDQVQIAMGKATTQISNLKPTDNYLHTPDYLFEYKGPNGKALDAGPALKYVAEQLYAVLPILSGYLSSDQNINPMLAQQAFRLMCSIANYIRSRLNVMFQSAFTRLEEEGGFSKIKMAFTDLDAETAETVARTQEYQSQNAASNRDNGFIDQDTAAAHATVKSPTGQVKKAAEPAALPPPVDPNKTAPGEKPTTGDPKKPPSKGGRSKVKDAAKGPKDRNRSAPTPDKRPKGKRHGEDLTVDDRILELLEYVNDMT